MSALLIVGCRFHSSVLASVFVHHLSPICLSSGSEKGVFWKRGLFRKVHLLEYLEILESRFSREFSDCGKERRFRRFSRDSREFRDFRDSRDFLQRETPFRNDPFFRSRFFRVALVRFSYGSVVERFERFRFSVSAVPLGKGFPVFQHRIIREGRFRLRFLENGSGGSSSNLSSWKTVPTVLVSGSGSVPWSISLFSLLCIILQLWHTPCHRRHPLPLCSDLLLLAFRENARKTTQKGWDFSSLVKTGEGLKIKESPCNKNKGNPRSSEGCKGHTHKKGIGKGTESHELHGIFRVFSGPSREFSGCFPYALSGRLPFGPFEEAGIRRRRSALIFLSLAFFDFLAFLPFKELLVFWSVFAFFSRDFRVSEETENPCFLVGSPCVFSKKNRGLCP